MAIGLYQAVIECRFLQVRYLIDKGADVCSKNTNGENVIIGAIRWISDPRRRGQMVKFLLSQSVNVSDYDKKFQRDALIWAAFLNRTDEVENIINTHEVDIDLRKTDAFQRSALHYAVLHNNLKVVSMLLDLYKKYRLTVEIPDQFKITPFIMASVLEYEECADLLVEKGDAYAKQPKPTNFSYSNLWEGCEDWYDSRYCILPSNTKANTSSKNSSPLSTNRIPTVDKLSPSLGSYSPVQISSRKSYGPMFLKHTTPRHGLQTGLENCPPTNRSSHSPENVGTFGHKDQIKKAMSLPQINYRSYYAVKKTPRSEYIGSGSFKRSVMPVLFDMYAQQGTYRPAAKSPELPKAEPVPFKKAKKGTITFGTLTNVTKFAAMMKSMKTRNTPPKMKL